MTKGFFNLTVYPKSTPKAVLDLNSYSYTWRRSGTRGARPQKIRARLIHLGDVKDVEEARGRARERGYALLGGEAAESFLRKFPVPGKTRRPIGFGGCYWECGRLTRDKISRECYWVRSDIKVFVNIYRSWDIHTDYPNGLGCGFGAHWLWAITPISAGK